MGTSLYVYHELGLSFEKSPFWKMFVSLIQSGASKDVLVIVPNESVRVFIYNIASKWAMEDSCLPRCITLTEWASNAVGVSRLLPSVFDRIIVSRVLADEALSLPASWQHQSMRDAILSLWESRSRYGWDSLMYRKYMGKQLASRISMVLDRCDQISADFKIMTLRRAVSLLMDSGFKFSDNFDFLTGSVLMYGFYYLCPVQKFMMRAFLKTSVISSILLKGLSGVQGLEAGAFSELEGWLGVSGIKNEVPSNEDVWSQVRICGYVDRSDEVSDAINWCRDNSDRAIVLVDYNGLRPKVRQVLSQFGLCIYKERVCFSDLLIGRYLRALLAFSVDSWAADEMEDLMLCFNAFQLNVKCDVSLLKKIDYDARKPLLRSVWEQGYRKLAAADFDDQWGRVLYFIEMRKRVSLISNMAQWDDFMRDVCRFDLNVDIEEGGEFLEKVFGELRSVMQILFKNRFLSNDLVREGLFLQVINSVYVERVRADGLKVVSLEDAYAANDAQFWVLGLDRFLDSSKQGGTLISGSCCDAMGWPGAAIQDKKEEYKLSMLLLGNAQSNKFSLVGQESEFDSFSIFGKDIKVLWSACNKKMGHGLKPRFLPSKVEKELIQSGRTVWSPSRLEDYLRCPYRYYLKENVGFVQEDEASLDLSESIWGELVHKVLAKGLIGEGYSFLAIKDRLMFHVKQFTEESDEDAWLAARWSQFSDDVGCLHEISTLLSDLCVQWEPVACEVPLAEVRLTSLGGSAYVSGKADLILKHRQYHWYVILDYKTGRKLPTRNDVEKGSYLQLPIYAMAAAETICLKEILEGCKFAGGYILHVNKAVQSLKLLLKHPLADKQIFPQKKGVRFQPVEWTPDFCERFSEKVVQVQKSIENNEICVDVEDKMISKRKEVCSFCSFKFLCTWKHRWESYG